MVKRYIHGEKGKGMFTFTVGMIKIISIKLAILQQYLH
jgi:hypothetical protein